MFYGLGTQEEAVTLAFIVCAALGNGLNNNASQLLIETAQQETKLGKYRDPTPYKAGHGLCQFDKIAFENIKRRIRDDDSKSLRKAPKVLLDRFGIELLKIEHRELEFSPLLSFVFCRLFYKLIPEIIPDSIQERGEYWKKYYNTVNGKGTAEEYLEAAKRIEVIY